MQGKVGGPSSGGEPSAPPMFWTTAPSVLCHWHERLGILGVVVQNIWRAEGSPPLQGSHGVGGTVQRINPPPPPHPTPHMLIGQLLQKKCIVAPSWSCGAEKVPLSFLGRCAFKGRPRRPLPSRSSEAGPGYGGCLPLGGLARAEGGPPVGPEAVHWIQRRSQQEPNPRLPTVAMAEADIALIGLAVMGQNLILNMNDHGFVVCAFNRTVSKVDDFLAKEAKGTKVIGAHSLEEMVSKLKEPRRIILLVKAGSAVDDFINKLVPLLSPGDIIIDGGNSEYRDSTRRCKELGEKGILFVGSGVSGGEEGARYGPSLMPGGAKEAWPHIKTIFQSIAAKVGTGEPCCDWVGDEGSGHFVKMVHNGIEYGDMQLICEAYHLMKDVLGMDHDEMAKVFEEWNKTELDSFLIEITANILKYRDADGKHLLPQIRDSAGQKGTGKWTAISALEYGVPVTLIGEAVFARCLSSLKDERVQASKLLHGPRAAKFSGNKSAFLEDIRKALYASKIISYAQGFMLFRQAAKEFGWTLNYGSIALMWRGGCIIRSVFLGKIKEAFDRNPDLQNLLLDDFFKTAVENCQDSWRRAISTGVQLGIPMPCFTTALSFYDGYRHGTLPANLIQAQRDYFGAHTYELVTKPGEFIHTNWTGHGGTVSSSSYNA